MKRQTAWDWVMLPIQIILFPFWCFVLFCMIMHGKWKQRNG